MKLSQLLGLIGVCAIATASVSAQNTATYFLNDHPDGNQAPPLYGLRLDGLFNADGNANSKEVFTFTFENDSASIPASVNPASAALIGATMTVDFDLALVTISGLIYGGWDVGTAWADPTLGYTGFWDLEFSYTMNVTSTGDPLNPELEAFISDFNAGSIDPLFDVGADGATTPDGPIALTDFNGNTSAPTFLFDSDGYRIAGDNDTFVGVGWVNHDGPGGPGLGGHVYASDFIFTAELDPGSLIPEPSTYAAAMVLGMAGFIYFRRRRA